MAASFSLLKSGKRFLFSAAQSKVPLTWCRNLTLTRALRQDGDTDQSEKTDDGKPRRQVVDVDTSIQYVNSQAFADGYGDKPVWFHYRRNFKGRFLPPTRKTCVRQGVVATSSPCPVCRDEYLVLDAKNTQLLSQFINPHTGEILDTTKTGLCQHQHRKLTLEVMRARDQGYIEMEVPFRTYDYNDYKR